MPSLVVYFHRNPITKEVFYVGCGLPKRPYSRSDRNEEWKEYVKEQGVEIEIYKSGLNKQEANYLEAYFISLFGRKGIDANGLLLNKSLYGESHIGGKHGEATKQLLRSYRKGVPVSDSHREKLINYYKTNPGTMLGKTMSEASRQRMSVARKKRITKDETRRKMSENRLGGKNPNAIRIIDSISGIEYSTLKEAAKAVGVSLSYLSMMINNKIINKTSLMLK
jgi:hypothetical protein